MTPERARGDRLLAELSVDYLTQPGVEVARMFASDGLRVHGKFFAFIGRDGRLVLKLPEKRVSELIDAGVASRVTIRNRSMREWASIELPEDGAGRWPDLLAEAYHFLKAR